LTSDEPWLSLHGSFQKEVNPSYRYEENLLKSGYCNIAGIDEAGRGPLCGPVVAASVILDRTSIPSGIKDSKKLKSLQREELYNEIIAKSPSVGIGIVDEREIDKYNILKSSILAMQKSYKNFAPPPDFLLIDGNRRLPVNIPQLPIIKGDSLSSSIAAASIVAKVVRDRIMLKFSKLFPNYNLDRNKGYPTKKHLEALEKYGPQRFYRKTFKPVKKFICKDHDTDFHRRIFGDLGEDKAVKFLENKGYEIVERNYHSPYGEIDIIAKNSGKLTFIEVKTRSGSSFGEPEEAINDKKINNIIKSSEHYLKENFDKDIAIDFEVISIKQTKDTKIRHLKLFD